MPTNMEPYQERVVVEKDALDKKIRDLTFFIKTSPVFATLEPIEQVRLKEQSDVMRRYSEILGERIAAFRPRDEASHA